MRINLRTTSIGWNLISNWKYKVAKTPTVYFKTRNLTINRVKINKFHFCVTLAIAVYFEASTRMLWKVAKKSMTFNVPKRAYGGKKVRFICILFASRKLYDFLFCSRDKCLKKHWTLFLGKNYNLIFFICSWPVSVFLPKSSLF